MLRARPLLIVDPPRGADVLARLAEVLAEHRVGHALIAGHGTFDEVELVESGVRETFATRSRIVALQGRAHAGDGEGQLRLWATVARNHGRGLELRAGAIVRAVAGELELIVTPLDPLGAAASLHGEPMPDGGEREPEAAAPTPAVARPPLRAGVAQPSSPWAALAEASADAQAPPPPPPPAAFVRGAPATVAKAPRVVPPPPPALAPPSAPPTPPRKRVSESADVYPEPGDLLDHFAFGRCVVLSSDGDELLIQHPTSGRTRTIRLRALLASAPIEEDGKRLFKLQQRRA